MDDPERVREEGLVLQYGVPPNPIDLVNPIDGAAFADARPRRVGASLTTETDEVPVYYVGLEDLIGNEEPTGRPKDLDDLTYLSKTN